MNKRRYHPVPGYFGPENCRASSIRMVLTSPLAALAYSLLRAVGETTAHAGLSDPNPIEPSRRMGQPILAPDARPRLLIGTDSAQPVRQRGVDARHPAQRAACAAALRVSKRQ